MLNSGQRERERGQGAGDAKETKAEMKPGCFSTLITPSFSKKKKENKERKTVGTKVHMIGAGVYINPSLPRILAIPPSQQESGWFLTKKC